MSEALAELRELADEELVARHDQHARRTMVGTGHYLAELARRDVDRQGERMIALTAEIRTLTRIILALTVVNVILVAAALFGWI